jgi:IclR family transcriptional regulator, KDG regulon repressor
MSIRNSASKNYLSQTVQKSIDILEAIDKSDKLLSVEEIASICNIPRSTAYRLIRTLEYRKFLEKDERGKYYIGLRMVGFGQKLLNRNILIEIANAPMRKLRDISGETTHMAINDNGKVLYISKVESTNPVRMFSMIGARFPLYSTAMGKIMLAYMPKEKIDNWMSTAKLQKRTESTITNKKQLIDQLRSIRKNGYAIDNLENEEEIRCLGAPIFDNTGLVVAAMSISGPAYRFDLEQCMKLVKPLIEETTAISLQLGYIQKKAI